ncbi:hypothetical protein, partial [Methylorubrum rhodesianum]|uniref:hypothetical protein n=1 Tax=Methylorubrum rhodesianum TaxID=29427 RepID=UPI001AED3767
QNADDLLFAEPALLHHPSPHRRTLASERGQTRGQGQRVPGLSAGQPFPCSRCYPDIFTDLGRIE